MTNREALWMSLNEIGRLVETGKYTGATIQTMQAIKEALSSCQCSECKVAIHASDCAVHSEPAYPKSECNCGAQPSVSVEQEPVAWSYWQSCLNDDGTQTAPWVHRLSKFQPSESIINKDITPLYTTPPQRPSRSDIKPLTESEIMEIVQTSCIGISPQEDTLRFVEAIEAAIWEKLK